MNNLTRIIRYNKPNPKIISRITVFMLNTIICVWLIFAFPLSVYASDHGGGGSSSEPTSTWTDEQKADYFATNFSRFLARFLGVIRGADSVDSVFNSFKNIYYTDTIQQNMTWEQWLAQDLGWTFDDKGEPTVTLSVNCLNAMQQAVDKWIDTQGYFYSPTYNIKDYVNLFPSKDKFNKFVDLCKSHHYVYIYYKSSSRSFTEYGYFTDLNVDNFVLSDSYDDWFYSYVYADDWTLGKTTTYKFNDDSIAYDSTSLRPFMPYKSTSELPTGGYYCVFTNGYDKMKVYRNMTSFKNDSIGNQTFYITNDYSKGATYNTTKTIDNSTLQNTISYETVQNFNQQYYDEHNTTANYETINNYITNYYETINNNGGSGGGGSGGGSDDSGGEIFDWLGSVGEILGSLIKGLGEIVVGLLDGISSVITSFIDTLPTQVNNLFGTLFDWLPPEIRSLIVLSITLSLIWGIIKLIRG